ncbi:hypothetical protein JW796_02550 [Candidatus Dojkabacteria bacterium]|nr:hypothetical protein [Candidatus Dojkabacteria bacterium]
MLLSITNGKILNNQLRDNLWLENKMYELWEEHFNDVPRKNLVVIRFGKRSARQLGSIKWANHKTTGVKKVVKRLEKQYKENIRNIFEDPRVSVITVTRLYQEEKIPEYVVDSTIAHEMIHYAHGFSSPLQQLYKHPHKGGLIRKDMQKRGMYLIWKKSKKWLKENWRDVVEKLL